MKSKWAYWIGVFLVVDHWLVHFKAWTCETRNLRKMKGGKGKVEDFSKKNHPISPQSPCFFKNLLSKIQVSPKSAGCVFCFVWIPPWSLVFSRLYFRCLHWSLVRAPWDDFMDVGEGGKDDIFEMDVDTQDMDEIFVWTFLLIMTNLVILTTVEDVALKLQGSWYLIYDQGPLYEIVGFMQDLLYLLRHSWACVYPLRSQRVAPLRFRPFLPPRFPLLCASKKRIADSCDMWKSTCITSLMQNKSSSGKTKIQSHFLRSGGTFSQNKQIRS